jgi:hypothetical protein
MDKLLYREEIDGFRQNNQITAVCFFAPLCFVVISGKLLIISNPASRGWRPGVRHESGGGF